ncbi:MAG: redoxin domain-containing protein [Candidatus Tectomicrobia bacterium]|uniref:Redoxin domain-containing protein n=1 Tax=Tectimicrobiota bacterium TaxID=2528274 RepID=A0A932GSF6_UNCTE|nr:redoxin domain-containing protein [Candidatus Tectomicrobia bacterium]
MFAFRATAMGVEPGLLKALGFEPQTVRPAPNFTLPDLNGGKKKLSDWRGKPILLVFWATW